MRLVNLARRRVFLDGIAESAESDAVRLRALDLLQHLDEREREEEPPPPRPVPSEEEQLQGFEAMLRLAVEIGLADAAIEQRAEKIAAERVREHFAVLDAQEAEDVPETGVHDS